MAANTILQNPFDFSNPVTEKSVLAGRERELEQASYYLDQSREGGSYSLALIGERASGKTSVMNALHEYANSTGLVAAQVRLDEGIAADDLDFFREIFHSLMSACAAKGLFGGEAGAEYDTFRRQVLTHDLDTNRADEAIAFGRVYATARAQDRDIPLSRRMLLEDLSVIVERCRAANIPAVVLLLDEGDVLAENHPLLQALRNLLMDSSNFSIIAAGTEYMFPAISAVFSPVPRQFVRINVGPLESWQDTRKAILRRLVLAGKDWAMPTDDVCQEIHNLTQGKPYEVMLVSHFAYRERTRGRQRVPMAITPIVMGAVANQLEQQNPSVGETMAKLRALDAKDAETVRELIALNGLSVNRFAMARLDLTGEFEASAFAQARSSVLETLTRLAETGFVSVVDDSLHVDADSFQRALIKYVVLGERDPESRPAPLLSNPRIQVAAKVRTALEKALQSELGLDDDAIFSELHPFDDAVSRRLAFDDELSLDEFSLQASCRLTYERRWTALVVFKMDDASAEIRERIRMRVHEESKRFSKFDVDLSDIKVEEVDRDAVQALQGEDVDPLQELVLDAQQAFTVGNQDLEDQVAKACAAVAKADRDGDAERTSELNNCAFMALAVGDSDTYLALSNRVDALGKPPILTRTTRALWEATQGSFDVALSMLDLDEDDAAKVTEHIDVPMYSARATCAGGALDPLRRSRRRRQAPGCDPGLQGRNRRQERRGVGCGCACGCQ